MKIHSQALTLTKVTTVILVAAGCPAAAQSKSTLTPYAKINAATAVSTVTNQRIRGNVALIDGAGGNVVALTGKEGILLVDTGIAVAGERVAKALGGFKGKPLRYVINTHWHWDHTDGNGWAHQLGAKLVAHPNTIRHLASKIRVEEWGHTFDPVPSADRPTEAVASERSIKIDDENVRIRAFMPGHTDGDLSVYFEKADVLVVGDSYWNGHYPFIDYVAGGSIDGTIRQAEAGLGMAGANTVIVPGHGPLARRTDLAGYRNMLVDIRSKVAALKKNGKSLNEVIAARPTAAYDGVWGTAVISPALFVTLVYRGV